jgi:ADP-ribose pyrophosphatase YjhB (NUDIX family)
VGTNVFLETIIGETEAGKLGHAIVQVFRGLEKRREGMREVAIPAEATRAGVSRDAYAAGRMGLTSACADVVSVIPGRDPVVPLIRRTDPPFQGCWWIMGGAVFNGRSLDEFLLWKLFGEGGVFKGNIAEFADRAALNPVNPTYEGASMVGYMGTYRTAAEDTEGTDRPPCDTINVCYMALLPPSWEKLLDHDKDHSGLRFATRSNLVFEDSCGHWYPRHVALRALWEYETAYYHHYGRSVRHM